MQARNLKNQKAVNFLDVVTKSIIQLSVVLTNIDS